MNIRGERRWSVQVPCRGLSELPSAKLIALQPSGVSKAVLDPKSHQGAFGEAFVRTLGVAAGLTVAKSEPDVTGDDFTFGYPGSLGGVFFPKMDVQVKSWSRPAEKRGEWSYRMTVDHFNNLAGRNYSLPRFLVLVVVPPDARDYVHAEQQGLLLRHAAYWVSLREEERVDTSTAATVAVSVPKANLLTVDVLLKLLGGPLSDTRNSA
ncbi:DUF4365 domain-containing protein [Amycolatopsis thailandensis]|uniref:DUF4365 domain-containing protein n=1 Tax=Amycolatopsis thailandensis TaxID=589330 RepID=UPI0036584C62